MVDDHEARPCPAVPPAAYRGTPWVSSRGRSERARFYSSGSMALAQAEGNPLFMRAFHLSAFAFILDGGEDPR
mgnify:CR=1 FL=1